MVQNGVSKKDVLERADQLDYFPLHLACPLGSLGPRSASAAVDGCGRYVSVRWAAIR